jgi:hypothetical protein
MGGAKMDKISSFEKEQAIKEFNLKQERQYKTGKFIVFTIATINIIGSIISAFTNFNLFSLIIQIVLSIALFCGISWVRYLFAIGAALGAFGILYVLIGEGIRPDTPAHVVASIAAYWVYCVISSIVLFASKSVSEFLYSQKNV